MVGLECLSERSLAGWSAGRHGVGPRIATAIGRGDGDIHRRVLRCHMLRQGERLVERDLHVGRADKGTGQGVIGPDNGSEGDDGQDEEEPVMVNAETTVLAPPLSWPEKPIQVTERMRQRLHGMFGACSSPGPWNLERKTSPIAISRHTGETSLRQYTSDSQHWPWKSRSDPVLRCLDRARTLPRVRACVVRFAAGGYRQRRGPFTASLSTRSFIR